jgi:LacI family transcriptional regulator
MTAAKTTENEGTATRASVRLKDLAAAAGVSVMTASRALRGESVAANTRQRVLAEAERFGYQSRVRQGRPRRMARRARPCVDVVVGTAVAPHGLYYSALLVAIERALAEREHDCVIRTVGADYAEFVSLCNTLRATTAEGVLITGHFSTEPLMTLLSCHTRCLLVDHTGDPSLPAAYESVAVDYADAARQAVRRLRSIGRSRIALLVGQEDHYFSRDMLRGYTEGLQLAGLAVDEHLVWRGDFTADGARTAVLDARKAGVNADAVFTNDEMAVGVLRALHEAGARVPDDVAVMGCDGLPMGACTIPSLTTLNIDTAAMATMAVEHMLAPRRTGDPPCHVRLCARIERRESA